MTSNITTYERHLDKAQLKCADMGVKAPNSEKVQIYIQQMYGTNPNIDRKTSNFRRIKLSRAQDDVYMT